MLVAGGVCGGHAPYGDVMFAFNDDADGNDADDDTWKMLNVEMVVPVCLLVFLFKGFSDKRELIRF